MSWKNKMTIELEDRLMEITYPEGLKVKGMEKNEKSLREMPFNASTCM